jgi:hypothetical protein
MPEGGSMTLKVGNVLLAIIFLYSQRGLATETVNSRGISDVNIPDDAQRYKQNGENHDVSLPDTYPERNIGHHEFTHPMSEEETVLLGQTPYCTAYSKTPKETIQLTLDAIDAFLKRRPVKHIETLLSALPPGIQQASFLRFSMGQFINNKKNMRAIRFASDGSGFIAPSHAHMDQGNTSLNVVLKNPNTPDSYDVATIEKEKGGWILKRDVTQSCVVCHGRNYQRFLYPGYAEDKKGQTRVLGDPNGCVKSDEKNYLMARLEPAKKDPFLCGLRMKIKQNDEGLCFTTSLNHSRPSNTMIIQALERSAADKALARLKLDPKRYNDLARAFLGTNDSMFCGLGRVSGKVPKYAQEMADKINRLYDKELPNHRDWQEHPTPLLYWKVLRLMGVDPSHDLNLNFPEKEHRDAPLCIAWNSVNEWGLIGALQFRVLQDLKKTDSKLREMFAKTDAMAQESENYFETPSDESSTFHKDETKYSMDMARVFTNIFHPLTAGKENALKARKLACTYINSTIPESLSPPSTPQSTIEIPPGKTNLKGNGLRAFFDNKCSSCHSTELRNGMVYLAKDGKQFEPIALSSLIKKIKDNPKMAKVLKPDTLKTLKTLISNTGS